MEKKNKLNIKFRNKGLILLSMGVSLVLVSCAPKQKKVTQYTPVGISYARKDLNFSDTERKKAEEKSKKGTAVIYYTDADTNDYIVGSELSITNSDGKEIDHYTTTNNFHLINHLKEGATYTIKEIKVPETYNNELCSYNFEYTHNSDNMSEEEYYTTTIFGITRKSNNHDLLKSQGYTGSIKVGAFEKGESYIPGVGFNVTNEKGQIIEEWQSTNTLHTVANLEDGKYYVNITNIPEEYKLEEVDGEQEIIIYNGQYNSKSSSGPIFYLNKKTKTKTKKLF